MKKENKFKVWDDINKLWFNPDNVVLTTEGKIFHKYLHYDLNYLQIVFYTGLKDKNGVEIYEGNILSYPDGSFEEFGDCKNKIETVKWDIANSYYLDYNYTLYDINNESQVIGHIFENPELLKQIVK